jgi:hypothetical protein
METKMPRDDYKELLQLSLAVLGVQPCNFYYPGAVHRARWMAKILYALKMFLFQHQFPMAPDQLERLQDICLFFCVVYAEAWTKCSISADAPINDLELVKTLHEFEKLTFYK